MARRAPDLLGRLPDPPGPTACVVGAGNVGSKLGLQLPPIGIKRIVLIDHDRIEPARNGRCCSIFADPKLSGRHKVEILAEAISARFPQVQVLAFARPLDLVGLARLRDLCPMIWMGALDSRRARYELARTTIVLRQPLIDLAIGGGPDELVARVRSTWKALEGTDPLGVWSARDWRLLDDRQPCGGSQARGGDDQRPVSSTISGSLAAALALAQIQKLLGGDLGDVGWETRVDLSHGSLVRCRLPDSNPEWSPLDRDCIDERESTVPVEAKTLAEIVEEAETRLGRGAEIVLNRRISPSFACRWCQRVDEAPGPIGAPHCVVCGEPLDAVLPVAGLTRDSLGSLADAPLRCLGTEDDLLLARSGDESRQLWLEYRLDRAVEACSS